MIESAGPRSGASGADPAFGRVDDRERPAHTSRARIIKTTCVRGSLPIITREARQHRLAARDEYLFLPFSCQNVVAVVIVVLFIT